MKRFISILLACCILLGNTGWALTAHYCMGERVGVHLRHIGFPTGGEHECSKCGMKKAANKNGCCNDEQVVIKGAQDALSAFACIQVPIIVADLPSAYFFIAERTPPICKGKPRNLSLLTGPPGHTGPPLFIKHCVFRI